MTNCKAVYLLFVVLLCNSDLSQGRQLPKECNAGPEYWCKSLKNAADCGAVGHCTSTVWETQNVVVNPNEISGKFIKLFKELKDVKDLINDDYLTIRVSSVCHDLQPGVPTQICRDNTVHLTPYLSHVLHSKTSPEVMCQIVGMCNNEKIAHHTSKQIPSIVKVPLFDKSVLVGGERCTWGPSYWCSNITTGHECKATHHCIERVWSKMRLPEDTDSICKICTDMVTQARDQLESNQTQEELKEVFEGSCKLIPIRLVADECIKLADQFVPDLVETLASQMNPQVVCSVAGLCNNAKIDALLKRYNEELAKRSACTNCHKTVGVLRKRFEATSYDDFLVGLLRACRGASSLSDSCSMLVFKYYEQLLELTRAELQPRAVCHMSGQCAHTFHAHHEFTFPVETTEYSATDDVPCEFCEQLVTHLRDVVVANTTEVEFFKILKGLCHQSGNFKSECLSLVEQYYPMIYNYLVSGLKPKEICSLIGICNTNSGEPVAPLVPIELTASVLPLATDRLIGADEAKINKLNNRVKLQNSKEDNAEVQPPKRSVRIEGEEIVPLPIERMFIDLPRSKTSCSFCQYFLHYIQVELSDSRTEDKIKQAVDKACDHLPQSIMAECKQFVTEYGPSVIALLVQEIDPASICPALGLCAQTEPVRRVAINADKSNCPLCLFAVEQLEQMLKNNRTEVSIRQALDNLCTHLSVKLRSECVDFVDAYSKQLIDMLLADLDAQAICVYLKLCKNDVSDPLHLTDSAKKSVNTPQINDLNRFRHGSMLPPSMLENGIGDIRTNEIPDNTANGRVVRPRTSPKTVCIICEFVMKEIDDQIKDKHNEDNIKKIVHGVCKTMPKSVRGECDQFVEKYADLVISLLAQELDPSEVCRELRLCGPAQEDLRKVKEDVLECALCDTVVMALQKALSSEPLDRDVVHLTEKACGLLPARYADRCHTLIEIYGVSMIHLILESGPKAVCHKIGMCAPGAGRFLEMYKEKRH